MPMAAEPKKQQKPNAVPTLELTLPLAGVAEVGYTRRHVEVQLNGPQSVAMRRLLDGMDATGCRLENGRRVASAADVVRWILEQV